MVRRRTKAERPTHPTKQLLIDTAVRLLDTVPAEQLTCDEVLNESGVSRGSLYHHFEDYPDLVEHALAARFATSVDESIRTIATVLEHATTLDEFRASIMAFSRDTQSPERQVRRFDRVVAFASATNSDRYRAALAQQQQRLTDAQADLIAEGQRRGWIRAEIDPQVASVFVQAYTLGRVVDDMSTHPLSSEAWAGFIELILERVLFEPPAV